jgi:hypothetical protein
LTLRSDLRVVFRDRLGVDIDMPIFSLTRCYVYWGRCFGVKSSQVNTLPKAKSETRSKQNKDIQKFSSVYSERGVVVAKNYVKSIKEV